MEKTIWRGIAVLLTALPVAWIGHSLELKDQAILKEFATVEQFRAFYAARVAGGVWSGYLGVSVLGFIYLLINEALATGLMMGFGRLTRKCNRTPNPAEHGTGCALP